MRRRDFIAALGGAAAWPIIAAAQSGSRVRRMGVLMNVAADNPEGQSRIAALVRGLEELGWSEGRNVRIAYRWGRNPDERRGYAADLAAMAPDVIVAGAASALEPLQRATREIPIVFVQVTDPVGAGFVASLARPGGNITGFSLFEFATSAKWLELLKEIAPQVRRVAVLRDPSLPAAVAQFAAMQAAAPAVGMELTPLGRLDHGTTEQDAARFAQQPNGALAVTVGSAATAQSRRIVDLAARNRLPAIFPFRFHVVNGGLVSYGPDSLDLFHRCASYVDRVLKGEKPADLPVQQPTKFELVINLTTAKALGVDVPATLLARADEVIE